MIYTVPLPVEKREYRESALLLKQQKLEYLITLRTPIGLLNNYSKFALWLAVCKPSCYKLQHIAPEQGSTNKQAFWALKAAEISKLTASLGDRLDK